MTEGSDEYALPITGQGVLRLKPRLLERYLDQDVEDVVVQATGFTLQIFVWSDRSNIVLRLPLDGFRSERPYTRSIHRNGVNLNRWLTPGKTIDSDEEVDDMHRGKIEAKDGSLEDKRVVLAEVATFEDSEVPENVV